jgi:hypothetical protein
MHARGRSETDSAAALMIAEGCAKRSDKIPALSRLSAVGLATPTLDLAISNCPQAPRVPATNSIDNTTAES